MIRLCTTLGSHLHITTFVNKANHQTISSLENLANNFVIFIIGVILLSLTLPTLEITNTTYKRKTIGKMQLKVTMDKKGIEVTKPFFGFETKMVQIFQYFT